MYAAGDIIDWDQQKQLAKVASHGDVVVANILAATKGLPPTTEYKGSMGSSRVHWPVSTFTLSLLSRSHRNIVWAKGRVRVYSPPVGNSSR